MTQLSVYFVLVSEATIYSYHFQIWICSLRSCTWSLPGLHLEAVGVYAVSSLPLQQFLVLMNPVSHDMQSPLLAASCP